MLKFLDVIIGPINKLFSSPGFTNVLKNSPLIIIPVLLYMLGSQYLQQIGDQEAEQNEIEKISMVLQSNPELKRPVSYYLLRTGNEEYREYLNVYLEVLDHFMEDDSTYSMQVAAAAFDFVTNMQKLFDDEFDSKLALDYFGSLKDRLNQALLSQILVESIKHDKEGKERVIELLSNDYLVKNRNCQVLEPVIRPYAEQQKVRRSTIREILPCKDDE